MPISNKKSRLSEIDSAILLLLKFSKDKGIKNLSKAQINKLIYLLEVEARKLTGMSFFNSNIVFHRQERGPISVEVKQSLDQLISNGMVKCYEENGKEYTAARACHEISNNKVKLNLPIEKIIFATSTFNIVYKTSRFNQRKIFDTAYATEPMRKITLEEQGGAKHNGRFIDFNLVSLDKDILEFNE